MLPARMAPSVHIRAVGMWPAIMSAAAAIGAVVGYVKGLVNGTAIVGVLIVCVAGSIIRDIRRGW